MPREKNNGRRKSALGRKCGGNAPESGRKNDVLAGAGSNDPAPVAIDAAMISLDAAEAVNSTKTNAPKAQGEASESIVRLPRLNFPQYRFRISRDEGGMSIWDGLRRMWLRLTPEEWVRQHLVRYLIEECGAPATAIKQEYPVLLGGQNQSADIVVFGTVNTARRTGETGQTNDTSGAKRAPHPILVAECKAPTIAIDEAVAAQVMRYNSVIGARYVVISNGLRHFINELAPDGSYSPLPDFPQLS